MLSKYFFRSWKQIGWIPLLALPALLFLAFGEAKAEGKVTIGRVEDVILLPWGISLPARIDTGAAKSSLDARELKILGDRAEFRLPEKYGGLRLCLPIVEWRHVRSPGARERRPVVEMDFCLGTNQIRSQVNLSDRSLVNYPLILGRNFLRDKFVVDVKRSRTTRPNCQEAPAK
jgi:hypothetical protein